MEGAAWLPAGGLSIPSKWLDPRRPAFSITPMALRLGPTIQIRPSAQGDPAVVDAATGQALPLDYHELSLLLWIAFPSASSAFRADTAPEISLLSGRVRRLIEQGLLVEDGAKPGGPSAAGGAGRPFFVLGSYRSGTTLLRYMLDSHSGLLCPPETKFISGLQEFVDYPQALPGMRSLGYTEDDVLFEARRLVEALIGGCARRSGKRIWIDKTPSYVRDIEFIEKLFFQQVSYIVVARHPLDCVDSMVRFFQDENAHAPNRDIARKVRVHGKGRYGWARYWDEVYARLHALRLGSPERTHLLRYEDLVADPEATLRPLLAFIGEPYEPAMVAEAFSREHASGFQDSSIRKTSEVHRRSVGRWKGWPAGEAAALWEIVGGTAEKFGYAGP